MSNYLKQPARFFVTTICNKMIKSDGALRQKAFSKGGEQDGEAKFF
jgi:hypothetical protein